MKKWAIGFFIVLYLSTSQFICLADGNFKDPYEKFNRVMFSINNKLDKWAMKPIARIYNTILPKPINRTIDNFFNNIATIPTIINDTLQVKFYQASISTCRFLINSSIGLLGFFDVSSKIGLEKSKNDFGLTLAKWGFTNSNYLVLPGLGPSTVRDAISVPADYFLTPYPYLEPTQRDISTGLELINKRAQLLKFQKVYNAMALDPYIFMRNAYLQHRKHLIKNNIGENYNSNKKDNISEENDDYYLEE